MKITIITGPFSCLPPFSIGAVEKLWHSVGIRLIEKGVDVTFISKKPNSYKYSENNEYIDGYERTGSWIKDFFKDLIYSWRALNKLTTSDIVILNSLWSPILIRFFKHKTKIAIYSVERYPKGQLKVYDAIGNIDYFRCCSTAVYKELLIQNPHLEKKSWVIPNFIDTNVFYCNKKRKLSPTPTIVYAGRVHEEKGLELLVNAIEFLNTHEKINLNLMIIGARDKARGGSGPEYVNKLKKIGLNMNISWVDPIYDSEKLAEQIRKGDIFCYPSVASQGETFGVAPLEAMALGIPVIVSNLECFKDFVSDYENAITFDHNSKNAVEELAYKIKNIIDSPELFDKLSREGSSVAKRFSIDEISKVYYRKFEELLNV